MSGGMLLAALAIAVAMSGIGASIVGLVNQYTPTPPDSHGEMMHHMYLEMAKFIPDEVPIVYYTAKCPECGRFVKKLYGLDNVVECHIHGVKAWDESPVDWAVKPVAPGVTLGEPVMTTGPIMIVPEPLAELENEGIADMIAIGARV